MTDEKERPDPSSDYVRKVAQETGITEEQVRQIIALVGYVHSSIVREARLLKSRKE